MIRKLVARTRRRLALAALLPFALAAAAACSGGSGAPAGPPALAAVPSTASPASLVLPIEQYLYTPSQTALLEYAAYESSRTCMQQYGLSAPNVAAPTGVYAGGLVALRYGPTDAQTAALYGYHRTAAALAPTNPRGQQTSLSTFSAAAFLVFTGVPRAGSAATASPATLLNGPGAIPSGGCRAEGDRTIAASAELAQSPAAEQIKNQGFADSQTDPRVAQVVLAWSHCMKAAGYDYASPVDAFGDPRWNTPSVSRLELDTAVADVACKQRTNLVRTWYAVEAAWETRLMAGDPGGRLAAELGDKRAQLARASALLGGAGRPAATPTPTATQTSTPAPTRAG
jgi:hypothetical protein